LINIDTDR